MGFCQKHISDKRLPREAFSDQGDVEVTKDIVTFNEEEDEDTLVEEGPLIETRHGVSRGHRPPLDSQRNMLISESRVKRDLIGAMSKWIKRL